MTITQIETQGKKCRVSLNDDPAFCVTKEDLKELGLFVGQTVDEALFSRIRILLCKNAKLRCLEILTARDKTVRQLKTILAGEGYPEDVIEEAVDYTASFGYVDDLRYCIRYIESKCSVKSRMQISAQLTERGVSPDVISRAFDEAECEETEAVILRWMEKKHFDPLTASEAEIKKFAASMVRKGFSWRDIAAVIKNTQKAK